MLPKLTFGSDEEEIPMDLTEHFVQSMEWLMLAQAQECVWQRAVIGENFSHPTGLMIELPQVATRMD